MTLDLSTLVLAVGDHTPGAQFCLLEAAAFQAGEPWSDHPACVSSVLGTYGRGLNDALPDAARQRLVPFVPRLLNTAGDGFDERRSYLALDWLTRTYLPAWLRLVPSLTAQADLLAASREVVDLESATAIGCVVRQAAARSAAVRDAAWDAAWDAARDAVRAAAGDAAWAAAGAAVRDAVRADLAPTVTVLQDSAIDLLDRMLSVTA